MTYADIVPPLHYISMPLNAEGNGPEMDKDKVARIQHELWDCNNLAVATVCDETTAKILALCFNARAAEFTRY